MTTKIVERLTEERDFLREALEYAYQRAMGIPESLLYSSLEELLEKHKERFGDADKLEEGE